LPKVEPPKYYQTDLQIPAPIPAPTVSFKIPYMKEMKEEDMPDGPL
jgi:hypothetical protein